MFISKRHEKRIRKPHGICITVFNSPQIELLSVNKTNSFCLSGNHWKFRTRVSTSHMTIKVKYQRGHAFIKINTPTPDLPSNHPRVYLQIIMPKSADIRSARPQRMDLSLSRYIPVFNWLVSRERPGRMNGRRIISGATLAAFL